MATPSEKNAGAAAADAGAAARDASTGAAVANMEFILDIPLEVTVELGRTKLLIHELLKLGQGSVIELSKLAGETLEILANQKLIARGEAVVVNEKFGVRLTEVVSPMERIERLR
ncbi:MAG: flagellar motor switch protein FliN [Desulfobacterales bacterium]|nr:flagellar motor switch protein FliN [Desulfobacterales bacterium]